jgi:hypothetical protein
MEKLLAGAARLVRGSTMPTESNSKARIFTVAGINVDRWNICTPQGIHGNYIAMVGQPHIGATLKLAKA